MEDFFRQVLMLPLVVIVTAENINFGKSTKRDNFKKNVPLISPILHNSTKIANTNNGADIKVYTLCDSMQLSPKRCNEFLSYGMIEKGGNWILRTKRAVDQNLPLNTNFLSWKIPLPIPIPSMRPWPTPKPRPRPRPRPRPVSNSGPKPRPIPRPRPKPRSGIIILT